MSFFTVTFPVMPDLHGFAGAAQSGTRTFPALPFAPRWMCAALAGPLSLLNVSFQASVEFFACSVAVAVKTPPAPAFAPVGFVDLLAGRHRRLV